MKKLLKYFITIMICVICLLNDTMWTLAASASLTGPDTVRAGDTITLKFNVSDSGKYGLEGTIAYDSSVVTLSSSTANINGWKLETNGNSFILYDDAMSSPISGNKTVITFKFKVNNAVATGTKIDIGINNIIATDGSSESNIGSAKYSVKVAAPLSTNANLSSLSVSGATLSPAFSSGTTSYDIGEVEFSTSKLDITYKTEDSKAKVTVSGNSLSVGKNTVSVTVKAENGTTKTYKITVVRKQDPNYVASNDATLGNLSVSAGSLSPVFSKQVTDYIVYLPYEAAGTTFTANGTMADLKAQGATAGNVVLNEGENTVIVTGKAEDGTTKDYKITVVVMPMYMGNVPSIEGSNSDDEMESESQEEISTEPKPTETTIDKETQTDEGTTNSQNNTDNSGSSVVIIVVGVIALLVGFGMCFVLFKTKIFK